MCSSASCTSKLRTLAAASVHYPKLRDVMLTIYKARHSHVTVKSIDENLVAGRFNSLVKIIGLTNYCELIDDDATVDAFAGQDNESAMLLCSEQGMPHIETHLQVTYAQAIEDCHAKLQDDPEHACISCQRPLQQKSLTKISVPCKKFAIDMWEKLKRYTLEVDPTVQSQALYVCDYCRTCLNKNELPNHILLLN